MRFPYAASFYNISAFYLQAREQFLQLLYSLIIKVSEYKNIRS